MAGLIQAAEMATDIFHAVSPGAVEAAVSELSATVERIASDAWRSAGLSKLNHEPAIASRASMLLPDLSEIETLKAINAWGDKATNEARLSIPDRPVIAEGSARLTYELKSEALPERNNVPFDWKNYGDYWEHGIDMVPTEVRSYRIGESRHAIIAEEYASAIDRAKVGDDPGEEKLVNRVSAEHIPALLEAMPDRTLFDRIFISGKPNPDNDWVTETWWKGVAIDKDQKFIGVMGQLRGELAMYEVNADEFLHTNVQHEWSHALRDKYRQHILTARFDDAATLEKEKWNVTPYANKNNEEQWALHGQRMLGQSGAEFIDTAENAPLRTVCYMKALEECLRDVPESAKSVDHKYFLERVRYVQDKIVPMAIEKAKEIVADPTWIPKAQERAQRLLDFLGHKP